jgi:hypothetical protein
MQPAGAAAAAEPARARGQATRAAARGGCMDLVHAAPAAWRLAARRAWRLAGGWPAVAAAKVGKSSGAEKPFFAIS